MIRFLTLSALVIFNLSLHAQVGIGNTNPKAILDISASNVATPLNTDGLLVPRVSAFPVTNPGADQNGMLLYLTTTIGVNTPGFYYWDQATTNWVKLITSASNTDDHDFYEIGSTNAPVNINSDIYRSGNLLIGNSTTVSNAKVVIEESSANKGMEIINNSNYTTSNPSLNPLLRLTSNANIDVNYGNSYSAININNTISKLGTGYTYNVGTSTNLQGNNNANWGDSRYIAGTDAIFLIGSRNEFANTSTNFRAIGTFNYFRTSNDGGRTGVFNSFGVPGSFGSNVDERKGLENYFQRDNTNAYHYGMKNTFSSSANDSYGVYNDWSNAPTTSPGDKYGIYTLIPNTTAGTHYGIYSDVTHGSGFAGYFLGRVSLGTTSINNYILPPSRGANNQIMLTDATGNVSWQDPSTLGVDDHDFYQEGSTTAPNSINDDIFTHGNVAIGKNTADYNLDIIENANTRTINLDNSTTTGIISGVFNNVSGVMTTADSQRGVYNLLGGSGNNPKYGIYNNITGVGTQNRYGSYNTLSTASESADFGTYNAITSSSSASPSSGIIYKYGTFNAINNSGTSHNFGTYNILNGSSSGQQIALFNWIKNTSAANIGSNYAIRNVLQLEGSGPQYGVSNDFKNASGSGDKVGVYNYLSSGNNASRIGVDNHFDGTGNGEHTGVFNRILGTGTGDKYGMRNSISNTSNATQFAIRNTLGGVGSTGYQYGVYNEFLDDNNTPQTGTSNIIVNDGSGVKTGLYNIVTGDGNDWHIGITNTIGGDGANQKIGIEHDIWGAGVGDKFGSRIIINPTSGGNHFGVYSQALKASGNVFAGFFVGNVAIGTQDFNLTTPNHYILPASRGTNNQIMQTDGTGNVSWVDTNTIISDDQNLTGATLTGTTLQLDIENGTSTSVDLAPLNYWSRAGTNLDVATAADDISFASDQTSITFPVPGATPSSMIYMFNGGTSNTDRMVLSHSSTYPDFGLEYEDSGDSFIFKGVGERVEIDLNTGFPLRVYGTARAVDFQSDTVTYPDYVFETYFNGSSKLNENYIFKPLSEVEAFIKSNGHLPGIKSYSEVKANDMSISLSETSVKNLEKIEELFIYAIELKKENDILKEKQKQLEERLKKIETLLLTKD